MQSIEAVYRFWWQCEVFCGFWISIQDSLSQGDSLSVNDRKESTKDCGLPPDSNYLFTAGSRATRPHNYLIEIGL